MFSNAKVSYTDTCGGSFTTEIAELRCYYAAPKNSAS